MAETSTPPARSSAVLSGLSLFYVGYAVGRLGGLAALPLVTRFLGPADFGRFEAYLAVLMIASIVLDAGVGAAVVRYHGSNAVRDPDLVTGALLVQLLASALAVAFMAPAMLLFASEESTRTILLVVVGFCVVEGLAVVGGGLLRASGRNALFFWLSAVRFISTVSFAALGAAAGPGQALFGVALGGWGFAIVSVIAGWKAARLEARPAASLVARYGVPLLATTAMTWSLGISDRVFLAEVVSPTELGQYGVNYRLGGAIATFLAGPLILAWLPVVRSITSVSGRYSLGVEWATAFTSIALGLVVMIMIMSPILVEILFGGEYEADRLPIAAGGVGGWLLGLSYLLSTPILLRDSTTMLALTAVAIVGVNMGLNFALIPAFGTTGAALATLMSYTALCVGVVAATGTSAVAWAGDKQVAVPALSLLIAVGLAGFPATAPIAAAILLGVSVTMVHRRRSLRRMSA